MSEFDTKRSGVEVKIVETGEIFNSIQACAKRLGASVGQVGQVCRGDNGLRTVHGYHVIRTKDSIPRFDISKKEYRGRPGLRVRIVETGEEFNSVTDCAKAIHGNIGMIHDVVRGNRNRHTYKGLHFEEIK